MASKNGQHKTHKIQILMIPHSLTLLLEGQAYILAAFGSYLLGKWLLFPSSAGIETRKQAYHADLRTNFFLYSLILAILAISAVYETILVVALRHSTMAP